MDFLLFSLIGYICGCLNGSQIIGKLKKVDIKNSGVKNPGASNTAILLGWKYGVIVALIDIGKAVVPILLFQTLYHGDNSHLLLYLLGLFVVLGHNYPITMNFKGGKGTASIIGMLFAIDWKMGLISFGVLIVVTLLSDYLAIGVLFMYLTFMTTTYLFDYGIGSTLVVAVLTFVSVIKHIENYTRIKNKTETRISNFLKRKKATD